MYKLLQIGTKSIDKRYYHFPTQQQRSSTVDAIVSSITSHNKYRLLSRRLPRRSEIRPCFNNKIYQAGFTSYYANCKIHTGSSGGSAGGGGGGGCNIRFTSSWATTEYTYNNQFQNYSNNWNNNYNKSKIETNNSRVKRADPTTTMPKRKGMTPNPTQSQQQQQALSNNSTSTSNAEKKSAFSKQFTDEKTGMIIVEEGSVRMCIDKADQNDVFYNPVQVQNRDLSILMLQLYGERRQQKIIEDMKRQKAHEMKQQQQQQQQQQQESLLEKPNEEKSENNRTSTLNTDDIETEPLVTQKSIHETQLSNDNEPHQEVPKANLEILDALAASGLRSLRYWKECSEHIKHITINDIDPVAGERALRNIEENKLSDILISKDEPFGRPYGIRVTTTDAIHIMYNSREKRIHRLNGIPKNSPSLPPEELSKFNWDIIDIDPYGSASNFIDSAVQAITSGGMLNVTCTDLRCLSGSHSPDAAFGRYGSVPIAKSQYFCESAIRMVLYTIASAAARCGRTIKPILSVGMDFYLRVFVEVYDDKRNIKNVSLNVGMIYQSTQCPSFYTQPLGQFGGSNNNVLQTTRVKTGVCTETGTPLKMAGPVWLGPLHDQDVLRAALARLGPPSNVPKKYRSPRPSPSQSDPSKDDHLATRDRLIGLLTSCLEELPDCPLYYKLDDLARCMRMSQPPLLDFQSAIINAGYRVSGYHKEPQAIKTDAPTHVIWDIVRAWVKRRPLGRPPPPGSLAEKVLSIESSIEVEFNRPQVIHDTKVAHSFVKRFPMNPEENWGPKARANPRSNPKRKNPDE